MLARISPIDRLPPELLSAIFLHLLPEPASWDLESVPYILGRVCRLWRALIPTLPALWASLNITCTKRILRPPLHTIHAHLLRSAALPLSIALDTYDPKYHGSPHPHFPAVLTALTAARSRWRHISISDGIMQETLNVIMQGSAPLLQSFHYTVIKAVSQPSTPLRLLQRFPRLKSSTPDIPRRPLGLGHGDNTWPRLTTLNVNGTLTVSDCLTLLRLSPRLSVATFDSIIHLGDINFSRFLHAALHTLHVVGPCASVLISALTLPALVELNLRLSHYASFLERYATLPEFLARSAPPLHTLSLTLLFAPEAELLRALALVDNLHTLSIVTSMYRWLLTDAFITALHPSLPSSLPPLCPHLRTLNIGHIRAPDGACTAMLRARWGTSARDHGVARLREVDITLEGVFNTHERDEAEMRALNAEGMAGTLHILHKPDP